MERTFSIRKFRLGILVYLKLILTKVLFRINLQYKYKIMTKTTDYKIMT